MSSSLLVSVNQTLNTCSALDGDYAELREEYLRQLSEHEDAALFKSGSASHLTASCFIFSSDLSETLLCLHGKGRFWVQVGGHLEIDDTSLRDAALREAAEETGLAGLAVLGACPCDLNSHDLSAAFGRCQTHLDVGFVAIADRAAPLITSDESTGLAWWPVDDLPEPLASGVGLRLSRARDYALANI